MLIAGSPVNQGHFYEFFLLNYYGNTGING